MPSAGAWPRMPAPPTSVKRAIRHGVDIIYHCDFADEEALDLLEAAKDRIFTGPAIGLALARLESLRGDNSAQARVYLDRLKPLLESTCRMHNEMRKRGIRIVTGGDYGFAVNPQGTNARDLEHFVTHFGFSPARHCRPRPVSAARSCCAATSLDWSSRAISPICCWSTAIRSPISGCCRTTALGVHHEGWRALSPCEGPPHLRRLH